MTQHNSHDHAWPARRDGRSRPAPLRVWQPLDASRVQCIACGKVFTTGSRAARDHHEANCAGLRYIR